MRISLLVLALLISGCNGDGAEDTCAKVYDECGLSWQVPDKSFSRAECVTQLDERSQVGDDEDMEWTEKLFDCAETATCDTVLECFRD